ncbi:MAG: Gfo/Idh/MocA family protein [Candidatus Howiella sp.]|jgi:predicted dehydrogenase
MKICVIGDSGGHIGSIFDGRRGGLEYVGAAASGEGEGMEDFLRLARGKGRDVPLYADWRRMLCEAKPDIVAVDTIFSRHAEVSCFALARGIHVYTEKPVATSLDSLDRLERAEKSGKARLFSMFTARYEPCFYTAKRLIEDGAVGEVRMLTAQKSYKLGSRPDFFKRRETYGGTAAWVAIHSIDQILWMSGRDCTDVFCRQSTAGNRGHGELEASVLISLGLSGACAAQVNADYLRPETAPSHGDDRVRVAGSAGVLEVIGGQVYLINGQSDGRSPWPLERPDPIFDGFLRLLEGEADSLFDDCSGIKAARVALSARESGDTGRVIRL